MSHFPSALIDHLTDLVFDFAKEPYRIQVAVARMLWMTLNPRRRHRHYPGAYDFSRYNLRAIFGTDQKFRQVNRDPMSRYFLVHRWRNGASVKDGNYNNGYTPMPWMKAALDSFLRSDDQCNLLNARGQVVRTAPRAIASSDKDGNPVTGWEPGDAPNLVKINTIRLRQFEDSYRLLLAASINDCLPRDFAYPGDVKVISLIEQSAALRLLASNSLVPGFLLHRYEQATAGRLYAQGLSLQNCHKAIRNAALHGHWDYDMRCCHFAILAQMAAQFDCHCPAISQYVEDKAALRAAIAEEVGITITQVKRVLTATAYGAPASIRLQDAIPSEIGVEAARRLYASPTYSAIKGEVTEAVSTIVRNHPKKSGTYINLFDKAISQAAKQSEIISHLVTGVEAVALRAAVRTCREDVVLLQHDGFVARQRVSREMIHQAVQEATEGCYRLFFEEDVIDGSLLDVAAAPGLVDLKLLDPHKELIRKDFQGVWSTAPVTIAAWAGQVPPAFPAPICEEEWPMPF